MTKLIVEVRIRVAAWLHRPGSPIRVVGCAEIRDVEHATGVRSSRDNHGTVSSDRVLGKNVVDTLIGSPGVAHAIPKFFNTRSRSKICEMRLPESRVYPGFAVGSEHHGQSDRGDQDQRKQHH